MKIPNESSGFVAITSVLVIASVVISIAITTSLTGIGEGQSALALHKGEETLEFVEGCMEDGLLKLRASAGYTGSSITRPEGTCTITVTGSNPNFTVTATTTATNYKKTIQAVVTRSSQLIIVSWKEI